MLHKWLGDWFDTLAYLLTVSLLLFFFGFYWKGEYQLRHAEVVLQEFLDNVSAKGAISPEEYEGLVKKVSEIDPGLQLEIVCNRYQIRPVYDYVSKEKLNQYFVSRNEKKKVTLAEYEPAPVQEPEDELCLQTESNESIMAAVQGEYLALPDENAAFSVTAVRPYQEVYAGEELITLCRVVSAEGVYYALADSVTAGASGEVLLEIEVNNKTYTAPVLVKCYPRTVTCPYGHRVVNTRAVLEETAQTGVLPCPYCKELPETIQCNLTVLYRKTGTELKKEEVWLTVEYKDGHTESVTPDAEEWQDTYDKNYCGVQVVTIRYRGEDETIVVVSENENCIQCNKECNERSYLDYRTFPYCMDCMAEVPLFTGEIYEEEEQVLTGDMVASLDEEGEFCLEYGDFVTIYISRAGRYQTMMQKEVKRRR